MKCTDCENWKKLGWSCNDAWSFQSGPDICTTYEPKAKTVPVCYISGPYTANTLNEVYENIQKSRKRALDFWSLGYGVISPHMNTAFMDGNDDHYIWLQGDLAIIKRLNPETDIMVMLKGWGDSVGACQEESLAREMGLSIAYD